MSEYRVLSLDGGGIRGVLTAILLERIVEAQPGFLDSVDLIAGTSTGGILALGLAAGLSPTELRSLYEERGQDIFDDSCWDDVVDLGKLRGAEYTQKSLRKLLKQILGRQTTLADLSKKVLIPAFDLDNGAESAEKRTWCPKFFHNFPGGDSDGDELAWKVGLRTSAAPTYFPSEEGFVDGGVFANNPSMAALAQTQDHRTLNHPPALKDVRLLSLGTGTTLNYISGKTLDWGYVQWARPLISLMMDGSMGVADFQCRQLLKNNYFRLSPALPADQSFPLDGIHQMGELIAMAVTLDIADVLDWLTHRWGLPTE